MSAARKDSLARSYACRTASCRHFSNYALNKACADGNFFRAVAIRPQRNCGAQGYNPANSGAAGEKPFVFPANALSSSASNLPSHAPPA